MKTFLLHLLLTFSVVNLFAQNEVAGNDDFEETITANFAKYWHNLPQEKVYLHTDKPYYSAGENIWFKAYLVNAATHFANARSQYVYVELINQTDSVVSRVKIKKDSIAFSGHIYLKPELPKGDYVLRAYTSWMRNIPNDFFFKKNIYIGNEIDDQVSCQVSYGDIIDNIKLPVRLTFTNIYHDPLVKKSVLVEQSWEKGWKAQKTYQTDSDGSIRLELEINPADTLRKHLNISIKEPDLEFSQTVFIPNFSDDFDIQFFPESGIFLSDNIQVIGFKAIGRDGLSVEVTGKLFDNEGEEITRIGTVHKGMGKTTILTKAGKSYHAVVESEKGTVKKVDLPPVQTQGIALQLTSNRKGYVIYKVFNNTGVASDSLCLLIHSRGVPYFIIDLSKHEGALPENILPEGIISFSVVDLAGKIYCERLYFSRNFKEPEIEMIPDKKTYGKREKVSLCFNVSSGNSEEIFDGDFSISVTDDLHVKPDSLGGSIKSYLLLTSDLKGYIEAPGEYFAGNSSSTREKTDILMLTQGWRRFDLSNLVQGKVPRPEYYLEAGQVLSGKVLNFLNRPAINNDVSALLPQEGRFFTTKTDSLGHYLIEGIEFTDSTDIVLKVNSKTKIVDVEIIPDEDEFPKPNVFIPLRQAEKLPPAPTEYFQMIREKYYTEGGMLVIGLNEITVKASTKTESPSDVYSNFADTKIDAKEMEQLKNLDLLTVLSTIAGVRVSGENVSIRGNSGPPLFLVDGMEVSDASEVRFISTMDVDGIAVFKGASASIFGSRGGNGVISITTKRGTPNRHVRAPSFTSVMPLGVQKPAEFYVPKYEVDSIRINHKADLRTTIYWNPELIPDSTGMVNVDFYTADKPNNYRIVLEGISKSGEICRFEDILIREN